MSTLHDDLRKAIVEPDPPGSKPMIVDSNESCSTVRAFAQFVRRASLSLVVTALAGSGAGYAQQPPPTAKSLAEAAARRYPQPVEAGKLVGRWVLQPMESQATLGWVRSVVKTADGSLDVVVNYGGVLGFFTHPIAVPLDAMTLVGQDMVVVGFTPDQLGKFTPYDGNGTTPLASDAIVRVGLSGPSH